MKKLISLFIVFATLSGVTLGKTVYVNANYPTNGNGTSWSSPYTNLQTAVTASSAGDLVLVTNGVYSPISTGNKAITIQSVEGSSVTSIDGGGTTRCATLGTGVVLKGFTVFNGYTTGSGGGVMYGSIYDSVVSNNLASAYGGGIYGASVVSNCVVAGNIARSGADGVVGGGILGSGVTVVMDSLISGNIATNTYAQAGGVGYATVYRCRIENNMARTGGGTSRCDVYDNSTIVSNIATYAGGGVGTYAANANKIHDSTIEYNSTIAAYGGGTLYMLGSNCVIRGNTANQNGGGSYSGTLTDCVISNNVTTLYDGGGTHSSTVTNCIISGNTANRDGGGAYGGTLTGCTISGNTANQRGGGFNSSTLFNSVISNNIAVVNGGGGYNGSINSCIVVGNTAPVGSQIRNQDVNFYAYNSTIIGACSFANTTRDIFNNIFYGANITFPPTAQVGFNTFSGTLTGGTIVGPNLASTDPQFTDPANNDFTLLPTSPCINKGANQYVTTATDLLGNPRIKDWRVDMGAYESQSTRFVTTPNALFPMGTKDVK